MSDNIQLIKQLLNYVEEYENEVGNMDIKEFSIFLKDRVIGSGETRMEESFDKNRFMEFRTFPEVEFSTLLTGLYRFAKHYIKKAFTRTSFKTLEEFGFLATLLREKSLLKNELINRHLLEISSGSEILKRLINQGFIMEYADELDKRAKRVILTESGQKELMIAFEEMYKVSKIVIGNLEKEEIQAALGIFHKLTFFHQHIVDRDRNASLEEINIKYL